MTEAEWLNAGDAERGHFLRQFSSSRKKRLLGCACCRQLWHLLVDPSGKQAIEVSERFADGSATKAELKRARQAVCRVRHGLGAPDQSHADLQYQRTFFAYWSVEVLASENAYPSGVVEAEKVLSLGTGNRNQACRRSQYGMLQDIFSATSRPATIKPALLRWNHGTLPAIARRIYEERAFHDLPILADALEDAGCTDAAILDHCRGPGPHVRGCWVVDLLLGKV